ncbi:MAG: hypothetical protein H7308_05035 [Chthonomonadaceae bacterium]|nr:hypothetical protein [Chthonomonadaceae bacterium]
MKRNALFLTFIALCAMLSPAFARPEYAKKELKPCSYCHVNASPNLKDMKTGVVYATTRNERGTWYETHDHTFDGYRATVAAKQTLPSFHALWRTSLKDSPRKAALADLSGDGKPRLVTLNEDGEKKGNAKIFLYKWNGKGWDEETNLSYVGRSDRMFVGNLVGNGRPVIATADSIVSLENGKLVQRPLTKSMNLVGAVRLKDNTERIMLAGQDNTLKTYSIVIREGGGSLSASTPLEGLSQEKIAWYDLHVTPELEAVVGKEGEGGLLALWKLPETNQAIFYRIRTNPDYDVAFESLTSRKLKYTLKGQAYHLVYGFLDGAELWASPPMVALPSDVSVYIGKGEFASGFLVLEKEAGADKTCPLTFYALDSMGDTKKTNVKPTETTPAEPLPKNVTPKK